MKGYKFKYHFILGMPEKQWRSYKINTSPIGSGSFSKVYYGKHTKLDMDVAIKRIPTNHLSQKLISKIKLEIDILNYIEHPNILRVFEIIHENDVIFIITEYCNGGTLTKYLNKSPDFNDDYERKIHYIRQLMNGIAYLHEKRIIHRDLKPDNILIHNGDIKICDFGFSTIIKNDSYMSSTICGTPLFMSPETLGCHPHTYSTDIWSLGIILYMIHHNNNHPFGDVRSIPEYCRKIKTPIRFANHIDEQWTDLIQKCLQIKQDQRPDIHQVLEMFIKIVEKPSESMLEKAELLLSAKHLDDFFESISDQSNLPTIPDNDLNHIDQIKTPDIDSFNSHMNDPSILMNPDKAPIVPDVSSYRSTNTKPIPINSRPNRSNSLTNSKIVIPRMESKSPDAQFSPHTYTEGISTKTPYLTMTQRMKWDERLKNNQDAYKILNNYYVCYDNYFNKSNLNDSGLNDSKQSSVNSSLAESIESMDLNSQNNESGSMEYNPSLDSRTKSSPRDIPTKRVNMTDSFPSVPGSSPLTPIFSIFKDSYRFIKNSVKHITI